MHRRHVLLSLASVAAAPLAAIPVVVAAPAEVADAPFRDGEIVYLNSGSPPLTAEPSARHGELVLVWWYDRGELKSEAFPPACLTRTQPPPTLA